MSSAEARQIAAGNPLSFLHVSKPEIDLAPDIDVHDAQVYAKGRENFDRLISQGALRQDEKPAFYLYRQVMGAHSQIGLVAAASCEDYLRGVVKKHELTRPDKEDDRVRHIETLNSQTGPVFLVYRAVKQMDEFVALQTSVPPDTDFTAADGIRHSAWAVREPTQIEFVRATFAKIPALYIADGHHRCAAAARVFQSRRGAGESAFFLSVIFPDSQVKILPYNRVLKDLNGFTPAQLLEKLRTVFMVLDSKAVKARHEKISREIMDLQLEKLTTARAKGLPGDSLATLWAVDPKTGEVTMSVESTACENATSNGEKTSFLKAEQVSALKSAFGQPNSKHELGLYLEGKWYALQFRPEVCAVKDTSESLDVTLLQKRVLAPIFGIDDPRTSQRVNFVGGIRGPAELEKLVNTKEYACAFSMFPTGIADLMAIADAGGIMPPKSTWFEPKLRDALFCHNL
jgi:uncharacterized protein (DUF1015 family)